MWFLSDQPDTIQCRHPSLRIRSPPPPPTTHDPSIPIPLYTSPPVFLTALDNQGVQIVALLQLRLDLLDDGREVWVILRLLSADIRAHWGEAPHLFWGRLLLLWQELVRERALEGPAEAEDAVV